MKTAEIKWCLAVNGDEYGSWDIGDGVGDILSGSHVCKPPCLLGLMCCGIIGDGHSLAM